VAVLSKYFVCVCDNARVKSIVASHTCLEMGILETSGSVPERERGGVGAAPPTGRTPRATPTT
jgi:hypothetical protein